MATSISSCKVLVAEDEPDIREFLVYLLEDAGCIVTAVGNGQEAVDASALADFQLAILDISMPILDGLAAAAIMRREHPAIQIALHTAMDEDWVQRRFKHYDAYWRKPMDAEALVQHLRRLTDQSSF